MKITVCPAMFAEGYVPLQYAGGCMEITDSIEGNMAQYARKAPEAWKEVGKDRMRKSHTSMERRKHKQFLIIESQ